MVCALIVWIPCQYRPISIELVQPPAPEKPPHPDTTPLHLVLWRVLPPMTLWGGGVTICPRPALLPSAGPVPCALCPVPCALCPLPCALCPVPCALCPVPCALCPVPCALCPVPCALCPVPCALCPVPCALCPALSSLRSIYLNLRLGDRTPNLAHSDPEMDCLGWTSLDPDTWEPGS